ncbi:MAG: pilus assembly FimT family protein, partial [Vicinamibacterales bacterium]
LIVIVMVGSLTLFAIPKFTVLVERNKVTAAREELSAAIATARAAAVQKGRTSTLFLSGNQMWVTVVTSDAGATTTVVPLKKFNTLYNVSVASKDPSLTSITFDMRGFLSPRLSSTGVWRIVGGKGKDSVCITTAGQLMPRSCSL